MSGKESICQSSITHFDVVAVEPEQNDQVLGLIADPLPESVRVRTNFVAVLDGVQVRGLHVVHIARLVAVGRSPNHAPVAGVMLELPHGEVDHGEGSHRLLFLLVEGHDPRREHGQFSGEVGQLLPLSLSSIEHLDVESSRNSCRFRAGLQKITKTMKCLFGGRLDDVLDHALHDADAGLVQAPLVPQPAQVSDHLILELVTGDGERIASNVLMV